MKSLLLKFAGPLQSWGTDSHFESRYTDRYPSKSAVIGMIAASLGLRREEDKEIENLNKLDFAVRVDQPGSMLRDYHIARQSIGKKDTYVTNRYYLQDAIFVVAVGSEDEDLVDMIGASLNSPYFQTFLGKRSLPINADFFIGSSRKNVIESLKEVEWQASNWHRSKFRKQNEISLEIISDEDLLDSKTTDLKRDYVISFSQKERKYGFRQIKKVNIKINIQHDAFKSIGG